MSVSASPAENLASGGVVKSTGRIAIDSDGCLPIRAELLAHVSVTAAVSKFAEAMATFGKAVRSTSVALRELRRSVRPTPQQRLRERSQEHRLAAKFRRSEAVWHNCVQGQPRVGHLIHNGRKS